MLFKEKHNIKKGGIMGNEIQTAFLGGIIMPNGEFLHNGKSIFLHIDDNLFLCDINVKKDDK